MKRLFIALGVSIFIASSCTITQKFDFNEDFSGTYMLEIDMSSMMSLMGDEMAGEDSTAEESSDEEKDMEELVENLKGMDGISDVVYENDEKMGRYMISYKFRDIDVLNLSMATAGMTKDMARDDHIFFTQKGSKLIYTIPNLNEGDDAPTADLAGMDDMMMDMMKYKLEFSFAGGVKKAKSKQLKKSLKTGDKDVRWHANFKEVMELEGETVITIQPK